MARSRVLSNVVALVGAALIVAPAPASANLRAPVVIPASPSGAIGKPTDSRLIVRSETLRFVCDFDQCAVHAQYKITAPSAGRFAFEFVSPVERAISVDIDPKEQQVTVTDLKRDPDPNERHHRGAPAPSYTARFEADLEGGNNDIEVSYSQPLGATERDYGYFKKHGRFVQEFAYLLGPLKQWSLDPDFSIALSVSIPREAPSWWKRHFGKVREIACMRSWDSVLDGKSEQRGDSFVYEATLRGSDFPDRLECHIGDDDLMPKRESKK